MHVYKYTENCITMLYIGLANKIVFIIFIFNYAKGKKMTLGIWKSWNHESGNSPRWIQKLPWFKMKK